ncbi:radical SAM protein [Streptomyces sp. NPDC048560]|uniref:radical SAM/SPASM domain-containing protein n=1 Tax=Streptomyces sp. NPDC048560 TaxID=3155488 RepID=UPI0034497144
MLPDRLQTDPYLTCVRPGDPPPVIYMTDTKGPTWPAITNPGTAAFGVIGLDRRVEWHHDRAALAALEKAATAPIDTSVLVAEFGQATVGQLAAKGWLQAPDDLCREYRLLTGQVEISAHCNWGCRSCPVSTDPKPRATMPMDLFTEIIGKLAPYETVKFVTFHFFNEPTLDRHFTDRVEVLRENGMKLSLFSNVSALTPAKIKAIGDASVLYDLIVNLPSLDPAEFRTLTGARTFHTSLANLDAAIDAGWPVKIAVNGVGADVHRNVEAIKKRYEHRGVIVYATQASDRAGELANEFAQNLNITGPLTGCSWPLNHAYFSVTGDLFICCNDYHQREVFGNIRDGSLHDIMTSPAAVQLRRRVFGVQEAPDDYICRGCHDQKPDFPHRQFRPLHTFPVLNTATADRACPKAG